MPGIWFISPFIVNVVISSKILLPKLITEEGIEICFNDLHLLKALFPIVFTDDGIVIYANDEHPENALSPRWNEYLV